MEAIILAGGLGTRLRLAVPNVPKVMAPIHGAPFLEYQLNYWRKQGVERFVLSTGYLAEQIGAHFGSSYRGAEIAYATEPSPRGTGGGLLFASEFLKSKSNFLVVNGDTYFTILLERLVDFHHSRRAGLTFALSPNQGGERYEGVELDETGRVTGLQSRGQSGVTFINGGIYLVGASGYETMQPFAGQFASLERDIFPKLLRNKIPVYGLAFDGPFIDIGIPSDYQRASTILKSELLNLRGNENEL